MEQVQYLVALRDKRDYDLAKKNKIKILEIIESNIEKNDLPYVDLNENDILKNSGML